MPTYKDILAEEEAKHRARVTAAQDYALNGALPSGAAPAATAAKSTAAATKASPTVYQQALSSFQPVNYDNVQYRGVDEGFRTANDADKARWAEIIAAQNAGDSARVTDLLNAMSAEGNFSGYYGDDGLYYGYARGYGGAGNGSYQPVIGGKLISSGTLDTNQWLTPDGKAYTGSLGGDLSSQGVWSYGDNRQQASGKLRAYDPSGADSPTLYNTGAQKGASQPAAQPASGGTAYQRALSSYIGGTPSTPSAPAATPYQAALNGYGKAPEYGGNEYQRLRDEYTAKAAEPWEGYDYANDPVFQAYKKQYTREGRRSSEDVMGQYAAMTGGRPSTAAMSAAQQAGNYYSAQIADKIPELYDQAYQRYLKQYQQMLGIAGAYDSYNQQDYSRYMDRLGQYNTDRTFQYQLNRDAVGDARYDNEWAQKLREYADSQGWKSKEWEQGLREYEDQMAQYNDKTAYQRAMDAWNMAQQEDDTAYSREQDAYNRRLNEAKLAISQFGDYSLLAELLGIDISGMNDQQVQTVLTGRGVVNGDGTVNDDAVRTVSAISTSGTPSIKSTFAPTLEHAPDYKKAITDFDTQGRTIVNDTYTGTPDPQHAYAHISTMEQANSYLVNHGVPKSSFNIPTEAAFNRERNDPNSDTAGYASYAEFLRDYVAYTLSQHPTSNSGVTINDI